MNAQDGIPGNAPTAAPVPVTKIKPAPGWVSLELGRVWHYRELLFFLIWRDVKVRYKQSVTWAPPGPSFNPSS